MIHSHPILVNIEKFNYLNSDTKKEQIMYTRLHAVNGIVGKGVKFERIRRVTGYLVGTLDRFNNGKRAEENDRVKHLHV